MWVRLDDEEGDDKKDGGEIRVEVDDDVGVDEETVENKKIVIKHQGKWVNMINELTD